MQTFDNAADAPEVMAHCQRVAHLCEQTTRPLSIEGPLGLGLILAARLHHTPGFASSAPRRGTKASSLAALVVNIATTILEGGAVARPIQAAAQVLRICNDFDEAVEFSSYDGDSISAAVTRFFTDARAQFPDDIVDALRNTVCAPFQVSFEKDLPVLPSAAAKLMASSEETLSAAEFESIAAVDPVLTGSLLRTANSALFASRSQICNLRQAILRLGIPFARKVLLAEAFRGVFASRSLAKLWTRSRNVAAAAHEIAGECGCDQGAAFIAGLLHDIGRLLIERCPADVRVKEEELLAAGFPGAYAEVLVYGRDHAELGAELLSRWNLPAEITEAIKFHHRPEAVDSPLVCILHLAELECAGGHLSAENLTAGMRRAAALQTTGAGEKPIHIDRRAAIFSVAG